MTIVRLVLAALVLFAVGRPAHAQSVEAEALFREAKELLKQGKLSEACAKFDASDRIEASVGTELNAADCHEKNNKLATAWAGFLKAASNAAKAGNDKAREAEARRRAGLLEPKLSYLTISVPESSRVSGLSIKRNGTDIDEALWNTGVPVDAGDYEIAGQAPGHEAWSTKVTLAVSEKKSVEVPRFKEITALVKPTPDQNKEPLENKDSEPIDTPRSASNTVTIVVATGAVVLLGGALGAELWARSTYDDAKSATDPATQDSLWHSANNKRYVADGLAISGVACAGVAVFLFVRHHGDAKPPASEAALAPIATPTLVGLGYAGSF